MGSEKSWQVKLKNQLSHLGVASQLKTRFAPSPTGHLHLGHLVNAALVWGIADALGSEVLLRIEDHDQSRCREPFVAGIKNDLEAFGFTWHRESRQSQQQQRYENALERLKLKQLIYRCQCTRKSFRHEISDAREWRYPGTCRSHQLSIKENEAHVLRCVMPDNDHDFSDAFVGACLQNPQTQCGDLVVRDRLGQWTYQFAVVVDDLCDGIDLVIRGQDLLASTGRQLALRSMLQPDSVPPIFLHHPLVLEADGKKMSKRASSLSLRWRLDAGEKVEDMLGEALFFAGLKPQAGPIKRDALKQLLESNLS